MPEHKLQSAEGAPEVKLSLVPKMLSPLVSAWVPRAYVVSFKLETEDKLLVRGRHKHFKRPNLFKKKQAGVKRYLIFLKFLRGKIKEKYFF